MIDFVGFRDISKSNRVFSNLLFDLGKSDDLAQVILHMFASDSLEVWIRMLNNLDYTHQRL